MAMYRWPIFAAMVVVAGDLLQGQFFELVGICKPLKSFDPLLDFTSKTRTLQQIPLRDPTSGSSQPGMEQW